MSESFFFGYGSLVNRQTHGFTPPYPAKATGWRRAWQSVPSSPLAYLTAVPDPDCTIEGLIAPVPDEGWAALDLREAAYERLDARSAIHHEAPGATEMAIYSIAPDRRLSPRADTPVLLSYLDVVVQGYLQEFGPEGADRFFATTSGWEAHFLDDRDAPRYPRAQILSNDERAFVDARLDALGARRIRA